MGFRLIRHLITHTGTQREATSVLQFGMQFALETQEDVPFAAPMIGKVAGRVLDDAYANGTELTSAPVGNATLTGMLRGLDLGPVGRPEGNVGDAHGYLAQDRQRASQSHGGIGGH